MYQKGSLSSADTEGTSSKVCQASLTKHFKISSIGSYFFRGEQGGKLRLEPGVCFLMADSATPESSALASGFGVSM